MNDDDDFDPFDDDDDDTDDESETVECPHCGRPMYEDAPQCPYCGMYVPEGGEYNPWTNRSWWWIALGLLGTVALIAALVMAF